MANHPIEKPRRKQPFWKAILWLAAGLGLFAYCLLSIYYDPGNLVAGFYLPLNLLGILFCIFAAHLLFSSRPQRVIASVIFQQAVLWLVLAYLVFLQPTSIGLPTLIFIAYLQVLTFLMFRLICFFRKRRKRLMNPHADHSETEGDVSTDLVDAEPPNPPLTNAIQSPAPAGFAPNLLDKGTALLLTAAGGFLLVCLAVLTPGPHLGIPFFLYLFPVFPLWAFLCGLAAWRGSPAVRGLQLPISGGSRLLQVGPFQIAALCLSPLFAITATLAAGVSRLLTFPFISLSCWLAGITLVVVGGWQLPAVKSRIARREWFLAAGLFVFALLLRLVLVSSIPYILEGDEAVFAIQSVRLLAGETNNLFFAPFAAHIRYQLLFPLLQAIPIALFGQTVLALRILPPLAGALSVFVLFWVTRRMFGILPALFAALLLATNHANIHFSRLGLSNIFDSLSFVIVLGVLWQAWESERRPSFVLAGLALGFSQYFYASARILPLVVLAFILGAGLLDLSRLKRSIPNLVISLIAVLAVLLPVIVYYFNDPIALASPVARVSELPATASGNGMAVSLNVFGDLIVRVNRGLLGFTLLPLTWFYQPGVAMLRLLPALLFMLGLSMLVYRWNWNRILFIGLWLLAFGVIGGLSESTPASQRYVASGPVLALVAGYGAAQLVELLKKIWPSATRLLWMAALLLVLWAGLDDARFYFFDYTAKRTYYDLNALAVQRLVDYVKPRTSEWEVVFMGPQEMDYESIPTFQYLLPQINQHVTVKKWCAEEIVRQLPAKKLVFFMTGGRKVDMQCLTAAFPGGKLTGEQTPTGQQIYWIYEYIVNRE